MRGHLILLAAACAVAVVPGAVWAGEDGAATSSRAGTSTTGLPVSAPPAAHRPEPRLAVPSLWPAAGSFPRTSGTGRLAGGALWWTDFLYDDHGARGVRTQSAVGAPPPSGSYAYPEGPAHRNGADVFGVAVALTDTDTFWRVDWNTLADPSVPIAAFGIDLDADPGTGVADWPAGAGVRSSGLEGALVVSGTGAWWHDLVAGTSVAVDEVGGASHVDLASRSFVVRLPRSVRPVSGVSSVRLVAGLADEGGDGFAPVPASLGALPGQPPVYNVAFRDYDDEPARGSTWMEAGQASALASGDVTPFAADVDWQALEAAATTPDVLRPGASNRWYVSSVELGTGVRPDGASIGGQPNFLGRVQPYTVWVPDAHDPERPAPLTWLLHSFGANHNQYMPNDTYAGVIDQLCEARGSLCVTTLGRGTDLFYLGEGELDLWEVWRELSSVVAVDLDRVTVTGYSMGGVGAFILPMAYPDVFAAGAPIDGGLKQGGDVHPGPLEMLANLRWTPVYIQHAAADQLVPLPVVMEIKEELDRLGYRYLLDVVASDHVVNGVLFSVTRAAEQLEAAVRAAAPPQVTYAWYPSRDRRDLGLAHDGAWWARGAVPRAEDTSARIEARTYARPHLDIVTSANSGVLPPPATGVWFQRSWTVEQAQDALRPTIDLALINVSAVELDIVGAGLVPDGPGSVAVVADGPTSLILDGLAPGTVVSVDGTRSTTVTATRRADVALGTGTSEVAWSMPMSRPAAAPILPATGGGPTAPWLVALHAAAILAGTARGLAYRAWPR